jgi:hypothetical protein
MHRATVAQSVERLGFGLNDRDSTPSTGKEVDFSLRHCAQSGSGVHPPSYPTGTERPGREADYLSPYSVEVKNQWSYASTHQIRLHGVVPN